MTRELGWAPFRFWCPGAHFLTQLLRPHHLLCNVLFPIPEEVLCLLAKLLEQSTAAAVVTEEGSYTLTFGWAWLLIGWAMVT